ncbi:ABC transporter ATP-binding protein [Herpetosiphon sp. NSE202]|uniref:ABC transporter ATP-binding protein n=1 Tax=Herpetosiphon sp. NSE202 TaxID=3351349 RepID=UPI00363D3415
MGSAIQLDKVAKIFSKGSSSVVAVDHVSLQIKAGDFLAIMGSSGCGKSTLLQLLGGLDTPTSGCINYGSVDIAQMNDAQLSQFRNRQVGFIFQAYNLLPELTILDNVALPLKYAGVAKPERRKRAAHVLEQVGLAERIQHMPSELSGGQEQRTAIARALVTKPAIILADEPTGNLDSHNRDHILELFHAINQAGTTFLIVTHDPVVGAAAQRILPMHDGKLGEAAQ